MTTRFQTNSNAKISKFEEQWISLVIMAFFDLCHMSEVQLTVPGPKVVMYVKHA